MTEEEVDANWKEQIKTANFHRKDAINSVEEQYFAILEGKVREQAQYVMHLRGTRFKRVGYKATVEKSKMLTLADKKLSKVITERNQHVLALDFQVTKEEALDLDSIYYKKMHGSDLANQRLAELYCYYKRSIEEEHYLHRDIATFIKGCHDRAQKLFDFSALGVGDTRLINMLIKKEQARISLFQKQLHPDQSVGDILGLIDDTSLNNDKEFINDFDQVGSDLGCSSEEDEAETKLNMLLGLIEEEEEREETYW